MEINNEMLSNYIENCFKIKNLTAQINELKTDNLNLLKELAASDKRLSIHWSNDTLLPTASDYGFTNYSQSFNNFTYRVKLVDLDKANFSKQMPLGISRLQWLQNDFKHKLKEGKVCNKCSSVPNLDYINSMVLIS